MSDHVEQLSALSRKTAATFLSRLFSKFIVVGSLSTILNYGLFFLCYQKFGVSYVPAAATGYITGVLFGFALNKCWTFRSKSKRHLRDVAAYSLVYAVSLVVGLGVLRGLVHGLGMEPLVANLLTIGVTTIMNFLGIKLFVFK